MNNLLPANIIFFEISETEEDLTLNCFTIADEDEKSSQKSNSTTEEVATKSTTSGGDTGRKEASHF